MAPVSEPRRSPDAVPYWWQGPETGQPDLDDPAHGRAAVCFRLPIPLTTVSMRRRGEFRGDSISNTAGHQGGASAGRGRLRNGPIFVNGRTAILIMSNQIVCVSRPCLPADCRRRVKKVRCR